MAVDPALSEKLRADIEAVLLGAQDDARDHARNGLMRGNTAAIDARVDQVTIRARAGVKS